MSLKAAHVFLKRVRAKASAVGVVLEGVSAVGEVSLVGAKPRGSLDCEGGKFEAPGELALNAESFTAADVFFAVVAASKVR